VPERDKVPLHLQRVGRKRSRLITKEKKEKEIGVRVTARRVKRHSLNLSAIKYPTFPRDWWVQFAEQTRELNGTGVRRSMDVYV
jgi:UDP-N-acetylglucosamine enolpyruvyl transferase